MLQSTPFVMKPFDGEYQHLLNVILMRFWLALTCFEILTFEIFYLKDLGQGNSVQHSQWSQSMAKVILTILHYLQPL